MLEGKDLLNLELCVVDGLIDQLTVQEGSILHLVRPDELLVSTGIAMEKERLNQIANDLIEQIDAISLAEAIKE
tara:strand:+ start:852 stop:1073 length:222 start_codon:yes stop_codon:yes gene_type:complete